MDTITSIPRAIISYYGRLLGYAVDAGLTVVGLSENIALACIGAALGGMQGTLFLAKTIAYDVTHPSKARHTAQQQLENLWGLLPALPQKRSGPRLPQQRRQRPKGLPPLENGEAQIVGAGAGYELNVAAADGVYAKGATAPAEPEVPIQPLTPENANFTTRAGGYGPGFGRPHEELFAGQQGQPVGSQLDGLGEPVSHYNVPSTGDAASLASLAGTTRLPGESRVEEGDAIASRGRDATYEDAFAPGFRPSYPPIPETNDAEAAHFKEALAPLSEPGLSPHKASVSEQEGITNPLYQEEAVVEGKGSDGRPHSAAGLALGAVAAGAGAVAGVALGVGSALGLAAPAKRLDQEVGQAAATGRVEESPLPLEAAHEMGTDLLPEPVKGFGPPSGVFSGEEEASVLARKLDEPMERAQDLRHRTAAILQQVEQQPLEAGAADSAAPAPAEQGVWLAGRLPITAGAPAVPAGAGQVEPEVVAGASEEPVLPVQVEESGEVSAPPLEEIREVGHVDERECTKPVEPAAIAAEPVPDTEVSPAPPSSPLPAAASASRRTPAVTASRLGPYGEPVLAAAEHAVPAEGLEGAGALAPAVLQPEMIGEPLGQVMEQKMQAAKEQVLGGRVPAEGIKRVPSALLDAGEEAALPVEVGGQVAPDIEAPEVQAPAPVLGLTPVGSAEREQPPLDSVQLPSSAATTTPAQHRSAPAAELPEVPASAAVPAAHEVPTVREVPAEAPAATTLAAVEGPEVASPVETSTVLEEKADAVPAVPAKGATATTTTTATAKDAKEVDEITPSTPTAETAVAAGKAEAAVPAVPAAAEAAPPAPTTPMKKKRGALRGPLHKLGKEFKKVFT